MAYTFGSADSLYEAASSTTIALALTVTAGDLIYVAPHAALNTTQTITDTGSNSWTQLDSIVAQGSSGYYSGHHYAYAGSSGSITITCTFGSAATDRAILVSCYSGLSGAPQTSVATSLGNPGDGTDILTTGNMTPTGQPAAVIAAFPNTYAISPSAGTGYTQDFIEGPGGGNIVFLESKRITSTSAVAATATKTGSSQWAGLALIVSEAGSAPTLMGQACL